ncbi:MAG: MFS transporter, partial [Lachnospiraceae bacterium]|nr:MFS transporter [Lachnospiraceae bacterium]
MTGLILTQTSGILKPIALILGYIMEGIFWVLDKIGIPNIGLSIILFTLVVYLLMLPLTIKQQKFSKFPAKMNPELQAIHVARIVDAFVDPTVGILSDKTNTRWGKYRPWVLWTALP